MATAVDIPAPVCETREEQGGDVVDQATSILINKLPSEEQHQAHTHNGLSMVEGDNFLTSPSISEVHSEVNNNPPDVSMVTEKLEQIVKDGTDIVPLGKPKSDDQPTAIAVNEETSSGRIQQSVEESDGLDKEETKESKTHESEGEAMYVRVETTYEKVGDVKPIEEDILENPHSGNALENPTESLHVAPENFEASILGQEKNMKSSAEDQSSRITLHENVGGETEEESTDAVYTQKGILESLSTIASSSPEEGSINSVPQEVSRDCNNGKIIDGTGTQKEVLENDFSNVSIEDVKGNLTEHQEPGNIEFCKNESTQSTVPEIESKIERSEDPSRATLDDIDEPEIEARACIEEQSVMTHPQGILDDKTEDEAGEMEGIVENVPTVLSTEKTEDDQLIQVGGQAKDAEHFTWNIVDEVKIDDENPSRAEMIKEENTESAESLHVSVEDIKPSALDQHTETTSFFKEKSLTEIPQEILDEETEEKKIDVSNDNGKDSLIQVDAREMEQDACLEKETEPSLKKASVEDATHDKSINLAEPKIGEVHYEVNNSSPEVSMVTEKPDQIVNDEAGIVQLGKPKSDHQPTAIVVIEETSMGRIQRDVEESDGLDEEEIKESKTYVSTDEIVGDEESDGLDEEEIKESKTYVSTDEIVGDVKQTDEDILENPKSGNILENPAESLHIAPENIEASILGQEGNITSTPEDQSTNGSLHENVREETEEISTDAVDTQKETIKGLPTIVSSSPEGGVTNAVLLEVTSDSSKEKIIDGTSTQKEVLETDYSNVSNEDVKGNSTEHEEPRNVEFCENEGTESAVLKIESKIEKSEDPSHATLEDINAPETETRSFTEEQSVATHPQGILDEKTEDEAVDADEMEGITETAPSFGSVENTEDNSCPKMENEDHLEKDTEQPSPVEDFTRNIVTDDVKIDEKNPSGAELREEENLENALLKEEVQKEKPSESLHALLEDIKPSDLDQNTETTGFLEQTNLTENPQEILGEETEEKTIDAVSFEDNSKDSLIQIDAREMGQGAYLEKDVESSLTNASVEDANHDEPVNLVETKIGNECNVELQNASEDHKASASEDIETTRSYEESLVMSENTIDATNTEEAAHEVHNVTIEIQHEHKEENSVTLEDANHDEPVNLVETKIGNECNVELQNASEDHKASASEDIETTQSYEESLVMSDNTIDATNTEEAAHEVHNVTIEIQHEHKEENSVALANCSQIEQEEHVEKDGENSSWTEAPIEETKAVESKNIQELENKEIDSVKAELESEKDSESTPVKKEAEVENPIDSLQTANQDIKASDSSQDTNNCIREQLPNANPEELSRDQTGKESVDAAEMEERLEDIVTNIPNGDNADNTPIEEDGSQEPTLKDASMVNLDAEEPAITHEAKAVGENEKITECTLVKEEVSTESSALGQDEETSSLEEKSLAQGIMDTKEDKPNGAIVAEEETPEDKENNGKTTPYEDIEENMLVQEDYPHLEQKKDLENDSENTSFREVLIGETTEGSLDKQEAQAEKLIESLQVPTEDIKASETCQETYSIDEKILHADPEEIPCDKKEEATTDSAYTETEDLELQNVENVPDVGSDNSQTEAEGPEKTSLDEASTRNNNDAESTITDDAIRADHEEIPCDKTEEATPDSAYTETENLELQNVENVPDVGSDNSQTEAEGPEKTSLGETSIGNNNDAESAVTDDAKFAGESIVKTDLLGNEVSIKCALVKEEAQEEKPIDSSQAAQEEIKASDSSQDTNYYIEEKSLTAYPQEIASDKTEIESIDAINRREESIEDILDGDGVVNSPIEEDGTQKPYLKEATTKNGNDDEPIIKNEAQLVGENEKDVECTLVKEEVCTELLLVAAQDTKVSALGQDKETSSLEVQSVTTNPQGFMDEAKEDKTSDATGAEEEIPTDKDVETTPYEDIDENLLVEVDCKQAERNEDTVHGSENTTSTEALIGDTGEGTLVKEDVKYNVEASDSCQETSFIEEKILMGDSQEISCDRIEGKAIDAAHSKKENPEEVAIKIPNASDEENSSIQVDGSQKPPVQGAPAIVYEAKFADESKVTTDLFQNETKTECGMVKEEVSVRSLQVENEDIKPTASSQDREISHLKEQGLTTDPQEIVSDHREDKSIDATELKEGVLLDKSNATSSHEDTIENSFTQVDCMQLEQNENLEKADTTSLTEALTADTIENIFVEEKAEEEDQHIEKLQVATEDMKASASCQETSPIEEHILTGGSQKISCDKTEEKTTNSAYTEKESFEDAAINIPSGNNEDNSPIELSDNSHKQSLKEASAENTSSHESTIRHDTKFADDLSENKKNIECDFIKEEASVKSLDVENEDTEGTASNQDRESDHVEEKGLITDTQGIKGDHKEDKIIDVIDLKEVTHEGKLQSNATISYENATENSADQVDFSQLEQNEHSEKDNEITSLTEALAADTTERTLVKKEAQNEDHTESLQVATEDNKAFSPCQETETSSTDEQVLITDPEDISRHKVIEKTIDASDNDKTTDVQVENEDIKVISSSQDEETSHFEEQGLNTNQGIMVGHKEDRTVDQDKSYATTSYEDSTESSILEVDCSQLEQKEHPEKDGDNTSSTEALAADFIESTLTMEEVQDEDHIEPLQAAIEDVKTFAPSQATITSKTEEQILTVDPENISRDKTIVNTIDASVKEKTLEVQEKNTEGMLKEDAYIEATEDIKASNSSEDRDAHSQEEQIFSENPEELKDENRESETFPKDEVPKEIEIIDFEARNIELKEDEDLKDASTSVNIAHEEKDSDSIAVMIPCTKDLDVVEEVAVGHLATDPDSKQEESSITEVPEVHMMISHKTVPDVTNLASEVVEEANSCGDKTDIEKIAVLDDGSTMIPTNETLPETDPREGPEIGTQVPEGEKEAEPVQHDPTEIDQKDTEEQLLIKDSEVISESKGVNDGEEKTNSDNCKEISGSSNSGVLEEDLASNFQESRRDITEEAEDGETQWQDEQLHVSALVHDSSPGKIENQVQELEKAPLPASDEKTTECYESEIVEDKIRNRERDDESFFNDKKAAERDEEETESGQENLISDEKVQTPTCTSEVVDFHPMLPSETSKVDHPIKKEDVATDREELNTGKIASDGNEDATIDNKRSITDLESKNDDEDPEIIQTTPSASEGQDVECTSVGETAALISECQRDGYEHANNSSATEERPDSKEAVLETVSQVQNCKLVAETEEAITEEKILEAAGEIESDKVEAEDISSLEETKHETEILKTQEGDKDVEDYYEGSHQEVVIVGSHLEKEANQEEEISTGFEEIKKENETEKVPKISEEADDKALEEIEKNLLGKEPIDRGLDQKEQSESAQEVTTAIDTEETQELDIGYIKTDGQNSNEEINRSIVAFPDEEENRTGADDTENEIAEDEGILNQNPKIPEIDAVAREMPKELDENITCEAPINTFHKTIEDSEVKKEQQEEHITRKPEILPLPELVQRRDSEKQNQKDEICGSDEVQPRDEENVLHSEEKGDEETKGDTWSKTKGEETETYVEPKQLNFSGTSEVPISDDAQVIPEDDESPITKNTSPGEECSNKSTKSLISTASGDTELTEQASEATRITAEMQGAEAGISSQAALPNATEVESRQVEKANGTCKVVAETSTLMDPPMNSTSNITMEVEDQQTKLHDLSHELIITDTEVMAEKNDPENLQNDRDVSKDVQGSNEGSFEVSNKENPVEASPDKNIKTSGEHNTEAVQKASVLETLEQGSKEQKLGSSPGSVTEGVNCEEQKIIDDKSNQLENSWNAETEKDSESNTYLSLMDDTAQHDKVEGSPRQIDSLSIPPEAKCSEIERAGKNIPTHLSGVNSTDVAELEVTPLPSKDKNVVPEADLTTVLSSQNANGNEKLCKHDLLETSKTEQQGADCGNEEKTNQETAEKPESKETNEPSLLDLFEVSTRKTSKMTEHSAIDDEPTTHTEDLHEEKPDEVQHDNAKTEEENCDEDELSEQKRSELSSEAPVMVDMADADVKVSPKKSHNILSGVGSKVKHSIAKVKKAITGKSSHPKPPSPKKTQVEK